jgi:Tol biopolymer transport system component
MTRTVARWGLAALLLAGCPLGRPEGSGAPAEAPEAPRLVVAERGPSGARLVVVREDGARLADLARRGDGTFLDMSPAFSPDGAWVAFASTRERGTPRPDRLETSLWLVAARPGSPPVRLTDDGGVDLSPAWTPDGRALVFASTRAGSFDLWRLELAGAAGALRAAGPPAPLTDLPGDEMSPSVGPDGSVAFTQIDGGAAGRRRIAIRAPGGAIRHVTDGPADTGPSFSPDGASIAFTAPHVRGGDQPGVDGDLWVVPAAGGTPALLVDAPSTDEVGAVWSGDGRWVFATSIYRSERGEARFSSVVYVDRWEAEPTVRILVDPAGAVPRIAVAVAPGVLDAGALHRGRLYRTELAAILRAAAGP